MRNQNAPQWLTEIQNKSWEPEILISGITLTFIFLLPNQILNFFGKLIQEYDTHYLISFILYAIITIMLTGLKFILLAHLILRGFWAGLVGISYVYPKGIRKSRMKEPEKANLFPKPVELVIQVEKICSILFAFVFTSFSFFLSTILLYIPIVLFRFIINDKTIYLYGIVIYTLVLVPLYVLLVSTKYTNTTIGKFFKANIFTNISMIFFTNIGIRKALFVFGSYFILIILMCLGQILDFGYFNRRGDRITTTTIPLINSNEYESERKGGIRIPKATIESFEISDDDLTLFVAYYEGDIHTIKKSAEHATTIREFYPHLTTSDLEMIDLIRVRIDTTVITDIPWYMIRKSETGQLGFRGIIDIGSLAPGHHDLIIDKLLWRRNKNVIKLIEPWAHIPFVKAA